MPRDAGERAAHAELGGALHAIGSLQDKLKSTAGYKEQLEPMLAAHVIPALVAARARPGQGGVVRRGVRGDRVRG